MLRETVEIVKSMWSRARRDLRGQVLPARRARSAIRSRCSSRTRRSGSAAAASSSRCASSRGTPTARTSAASRTSSRTSARCCRSHCNAVGRDYDEIAQDVVARGVHPRGRRRDRRGGSRSFFGEPFESWRAAGNLVGTPEQVAEKMQAVRRPRLLRLRPLVLRLPRHRVDAPLRRAGHPQLPLKRAGQRHPKIHDCRSMRRA